jgi:hypothetical protein
MQHNLAQAIAFDANALYYDKIWLYVYIEFELSKDDDDDE